VIRNLVSLSMWSVVRRKLRTNIMLTQKKTNNMDIVIFDFFLSKLKRYVVPKKKIYSLFLFLLVEYIKFKYKFNIVKNKNDESVN
jgi:hypothetical protein